MLVYANAYDALTDDERKFVEAFVGNPRMCAALAAKETGLPKAGSYYMRQPHIRQAILELLQKNAPTPAEIFTRLAFIMRADIGDYVTQAEDGSVTLDWAQAKAAGSTRCIKSITLAEGPKGKSVRIEMYDAQQAAENLGKLWGMFKQQVDVNVDVRGIDEAIERGLAMAAARRQDAAALPAGGGDRDGTALPSGPDRSEPL